MLFALRLARPAITERDVFMLAVMFRSRRLEFDILRREADVSFDEVRYCQQCALAEVLCADGWITPRICAEFVAERADCGEFEPFWIDYQKWLEEFHATVRRVHQNRWIQIPQRDAILAALGEVFIKDRIAAPDDLFAAMAAAKASAIGRAGASFDPDDRENLALAGDFRIALAKGMPFYKFVRVGGYGQLRLSAHQIRDAIRTKKQEKALSLDVANDVGDDRTVIEKTKDRTCAQPGDVFEAAESLAAIRGLLEAHVARRIAEEGERTAAALVLRFLIDLLSRTRTATEVANLGGVSPDSVQKAFVKERERLRLDPRLRSLAGNDR